MPVTHETATINAMAGPTRTILLTGASGVVGQALLPRLLERGDVRVVALVHRTPVSGEHITSVRGDISAPLLGLDVAEYEDLAQRVDAVIHCAAVTDFNRTDGSLVATNVAGTEQMVAFAAVAGVTLYHVSTAFVDTTVEGERGSTAIGYAASKSTAETVVRESGVPHVILRPSVVVGDAETGAVTAFQGLHQVVAGLFSGMVPMIPFDPSWPIDFVACDVVADAIATVVEAEVDEGEFWITAGSQALRLDEAFDLAVDYAGRLGLELDTPRFVPPDLFDRLIGPVFIDALPPAIRSSVLKMLEFFATYLQSGRTMPDSHEELAALGARPLPDPRAVLTTSLHYWSDVKGFCSCSDVEQVA